MCDRTASLYSTFLSLLYLFNIYVMFMYYSRILNKKKYYIDSKTYRPIILLKIIKKILKLILAKFINNLIKKYYFLLIEYLNLNLKYFI